jgi:hypothetical protein
MTPARTATDHRGHVRADYVARLPRCPPESQAAATGLRRLERPRSTEGGQPGRGRTVVHGRLRRAIGGKDRDVKPDSPSSTGCEEVTMLTILLIIILVLLLFGGGFGYSRRGRRL